MERLRVFISHSTHTDKTAEAYLDALRAALKDEPDIRTLVDRECLDLGDNWRRAIYHWLDRAQAAIVLLSKDALESKWVGAELAILSFRQFRSSSNSQTPDFPVVVVLLAPEVDENSMAAKLGYGDKSDIQLLVASKVNVDSKVAVKVAVDEDVRRIVERLRRLVRARRSSSPIDARETTIAWMLNQPPIGLDDLPKSVLRRYVTDQTDAESLAQMQLEVDELEQLLDAHGAAAALAHLLLHADFESACDLLERLAQAVEPYRSTAWAATGRALLGVLKELSCTWVPEGAATTVAWIATRTDAESLPYNRNLAVINTDQWILNSLMRRVYGRPVGKDFAVVRLARSDCLDVATIERQISTSFADKQARVAGDRKRAPVDLSVIFRQRKVFVVFPDAVDDSLLKDFRDKYKEPTLIVPSVKRVDGACTDLRNCVDFVHYLWELDSNLVGAKLQRLDDVESTLGQLINDDD